MVGHLTEDGGKSVKRSSIRFKIDLHPREKRMVEFILACGVGALFTAFYELTGSIPASVIYTLTSTAACVVAANKICKVFK